MVRSCWRAEGSTSPGLVVCITVWPRKLLGCESFYHLTFVTGSTRHNHPGVASRGTSKLSEGAGTDHSGRFPGPAVCPLVPEPHKLWS